MEAEDRAENLSETASYAVHLFEQLPDNVQERIIELLKSIIDKPQ